MATCSCSVNGAGGRHDAADRAAARHAPRQCGDRNRKSCNRESRSWGHALQRAGERPRDLTTCTADSYRAETKVSCVALASSRVTKGGGNSGARVTVRTSVRAMHRSPSARSSSSGAALCRSASGSACRSGSPATAGTITYTRRCHRTAPALRTSRRAPYRPIHSTGSQYPIISDAICCELQSRQ